VTEAPQNRRFELSMVRTSAAKAASNPEIMVLVNAEPRNHHNHLSFDCRSRKQNPKISTKNDPTDGPLGLLPALRK
jgi:hypothetical protein